MEAGSNVAVKVELGMEMRPGQWRGDEATRVSRSIQASRSHPSIIILTTTHHRLATHRHITSIAIKNLQTTLWLCCISYLPSSPLLRPHPLHTGAITRDKGRFTLLLPRRRATASSLSLYSHHFVCLDFQLPFSLAALVSKLLFGFSDRVSFSLVWTGPPGRRLSATCQAGGEAA